MCRDSFKFRGACNAILSLSDDGAQKGVLTHSRFGDTAHCVA
jgi:threonine dehydratase